jgi:hypothetical protein
MLIVKFHFCIFQDFTITINKKKSSVQRFIFAKNKIYLRTSRYLKRKTGLMESYQDHQQFFHSLILIVEDHTATTFA